jgi:hypothetical protein
VTAGSYGSGSYLSISGHLGAAAIFSYGRFRNTHPNHKPDAPDPDVGRPAILDTADWSAI